MYGAFMQPIITIRKGTLLQIPVMNGDDTVTLFDETEKALIEVHANNINPVEVPTSAREPGKYHAVVETASGDLIDVYPVKIIGLFEQESRIDTLKEQIALIDKVITAKLSDDNGVLTQLSINNKTLVYSSMQDLIALVGSLREQLNAAIHKENRKKGKAPFKQIKLVLNRG